MDDDRHPDDRPSDGSGLFFAPGTPEELQAHIRAAHAEHEFHQSLIKMELLNTLDSLDEVQARVFDSILSAICLAGGSAREVAQWYKGYIAALRYTHHDVDPMTGETLTPPPGDPRATFTRESVPPPQEPDDDALARARAAHPSGEQEPPPTDLVMLVGGSWIRCHPAGTCRHEHCPVHNPSDHHMATWRQHWRADRSLVERICPHGVGHPDPDDDSMDRIHGCDGCCAPPLPDDCHVWLQGEIGSALAHPPTCQGEGDCPVDRAISAHPPAALNPGRYKIEMHGDDHYTIEAL